MEYPAIGEFDGIRGNGQRDDDGKGLEKAENTGHDGGVLLSDASSCFAFW